MEIPESIINIVILIAVGIISLVNAIQKKKKQAEATLPTGSHRLPPEPKRTKKIQKEKKTPPIPISKQARFADNYQRITTSFQEDQEDEVIPDNESQEYPQDQIDLSSPERLRQAVIYAEIINRKYS